MLFVYAFPKRIMVIVIGEIERIMDRKLEH